MQIGNDMLPVFFLRSAMNRLEIWILPYAFLCQVNGELFKTLGT